MTNRSLASRYLLDMFMSNNDDVENEHEELLLASLEEEARTSIKNQNKRGRGSVFGRLTVGRDISSGHQMLYRDYFADQPVYGPRYFRRRFRMKRDLFLQIQHAVENHDSYFIQKRNAAGYLGLSSLQKVTAALRMLAYGVPADYVDGYVRIGQSTAIESLKRFVKAVIAIFGDEYLRSPDENDLTRLLAKGEKRGFRGMLGSIDCMHWRWTNCPTAWHGMYSGHVREPTIILEAVASYDLWIWHAFFGLPGSNNDINVLERSSVFTELAEGRAPAVNYSINGNPYKMGYYLADGIYPSWATFVKTIPAPQGPKRKHFAKQQEACRKDVERAFGVLQARFAIVRGPARFWDKETLKDIMTACIVMHNMIIEDERDEHERRSGATYDIQTEYDFVEDIANITVSREYTATLAEFMETHHSIRDRQTHTRLLEDLIEHLWNMYGEA